MIHKRYSNNGPQALLRNDPRLLLKNDPQPLHKKQATIATQKMVHKCYSKMMHNYYSKIINKCQSKMIDKCYSKMFKKLFYQEILTRSLLFFIEKQLLPVTICQYCKQFINTKLTCVLRLVVGYCHYKNSSCLNINRLKN